MAGMQTVHQIYEKIEVQGVGKAKQDFKSLGGAADDAAKSLGMTQKSGQQLEFGFAKVEKAAAKMGKATKEAGKKSKLMGELAGSSIGKMVTSFTLAGIAVTALTKGFGFLWGKMRDAWQMGLLVNREFEAQQSRVQGLLLGLLDWQKIGSKNPVADSLKTTNSLIREFRDIGFDAATPVPRIEAAYARLNSILAGTGRTQKDIVDFTRMSASAAKIYGENAEMAGGIVAKAIFQGVVEGESAFAQAFKSQAQITSKMPIEKRIEKIKGVLSSMGAPLATVTKDTASWQTRLGIITEDILQRMTYPIWQKIGDVTESVVGYLKDNEQTLYAIADEAGEWFQMGWQVATATWETVKGMGQILWALGKGESKTSYWLGRLKMVRQFVDIIAFGWRALVESIKVATGESQGMGKLLAISKAIELKWKEISLQIVKVVKAFAKMAVPDFIAERVPAVKGFFNTMDKVAEDINGEIKVTAKSLRALEKAAGMGPLTETTRNMVREQGGLDMSKKERDDLFSKLFGRKLKIEQNIDKVEINQDLRGEDPDRILIEIIRNLESLGERALQSTAGGELTALEAGATGG